MEGSEAAIKFLDGKIAETEQEVERLQQLLTDVESDLRALRKARDVLAGEHAALGPLPAAGHPEETTSLPQPTGASPGLDEVKRGEPVTPAGRSGGGSRQGPIRSLILEILREAGKPLHVDELIERLQAAGKHTDSATVTVTLAEYVKAGKLWRTAQGTYGLPKGFGL